MAGNTGDVKAGRAYIELALNKSLLVKGLKGVATEMKAFGAGISSIGKKFMMMGAAIMAPMLVAAKSWASGGGELIHMSERTGMAVEALSALSYTAEITGTSIETVEVGLKKMQKAIYESAQGKGTGPKFLQDLIKLKPEEQLAAIADQLDKAKNPAEKTAIALKIFGKAGTAMLPMLQGGAKGLAAFRKEAEDMGRIRSTESAESAHQLELAYEKLTGSISSFKNAIGGAIGPLLTEFFTGIRSNVLAARDWIKANQPLVANIFKIGVAASAAGIGLFVLGKVVGGIGLIFSGAAKVIGIFGHVISLLLMPVKMVFNMLSSLASGVLSMVMKGFSLVGDVVSGAVTAGLWVMNTAISACTTVWGIMTGTVAVCKTVLSGFAAVGDFIITVIGGIASALVAVVTGAMTLIGLLGPIGLAGAALAAVGGLFLFKNVLNDLGKAAGSVGKGLSDAKDAAGGVFDKAADAAKSAGSSIGETIKSWGSNLKDFGVGLYEVTSKVFTRLWNDVSIGFKNLVKDVGDSWGLIETLLSQGNFSQAWSVGLALMKLEWVRFSNYIVSMWREITPKFNEGISTVANAIGNVGGTIGNIFAELKISWGDIWDSLMEGLKKFLGLLDSAMSTVKDYIGRTQAFMGNDPTALMEEKKRLAGLRKRSIETGMDTTGVDRAIADNERAIRANKWLLENGAPLQNSVPGARTPEQKAADEEAARAQGEAVGDAIKDAADSAAKAIEGGTTQKPGERDAEKNKAADDEAKAMQELDDARNEAAKAAKETAAKRKEEQDKLMAGAGGEDGDMGLQFAGGSNKSLGTFSASAVSGMGMGSPIQKLHDMTKGALDRLAKIDENLLREQRRMTLEATA